MAAESFSERLQKAYSQQNFHKVLELIERDNKDHLEELDKILASREKHFWTTNPLPINRDKTRNLTLIQMSIAQGRADILKILSKHIESLSFFPNENRANMKRAVESGNLETVKYIANVVGTHCLGYGLNVACKMGNPEIVKVFLACEAKMAYYEEHVADIYKIHGTGFEDACKKGHVEVVKLLLDSLTFVDDPSAYSFDDHRRQTAASYASLDKTIKVLSENISKDDPSLVGKQRQVYHLLAEKRGQLELAKFERREALEVKPAAALESAKVSSEAVEKPEKTSDAAPAAAPVAAPASTPALAPHPAAPQSSLRSTLTAIFWPTVPRTQPATANVETRVRETKPV